MNPPGVDVEPRIQARRAIEAVRPYGDRALLAAPQHGVGTRGDPKTHTCIPVKETLDPTCATR